MTRSELIEALARKQFQLTRKDVELAVNNILDGIAHILAKRGRAEIRGFGSFEINKRPPRKGRNPKTGAVVLIPAKEVPHFKVGKELRERVNYK
jgi:integration host factor subunit beta